MKWESIIKPHRERVVLPNLTDYAQTCRNFKWTEALNELNGLPGGAGLNIAFETVDCHVIGPRRDQLALRWLGREGEVRDFTYTQLRGLSNHFANVLRTLDLHEGETVCTLLGRLPEVFVVALGTFKQRGIFCPLPSGLGTAAIRQRVALVGAKLLITTEPLYLRNIAPIRDSLPSLRHIILVGEDHRQTNTPGTHDYHSLIYDASGQFRIGPTGNDDPALIYFTGDPAGEPRAVVHSHQAVVAHYVSGRYALDLHDGDVCWCTADPGEAMGTSYAMLAPLANGVTTIVDEAEFDVERSYRVIEEQKVSVWYTTPPAIQRMVAAGGSLPERYDLSSIRFPASGGPLDPAAVIWSHRALGEPFHDNWWQPETGAIMIANFAGLDLHPGSIGRPLPGIEAAIVEISPEGAMRVIGEPNVEGQLVLRRGWPSMFRGYLNDEEGFRRRFVNGCYLTGERAKRDEEGNYWLTSHAAVKA